MAELLGTPGEYDRITTELQGVIFKDPSADPTDPEAGWQMADEYLSGDVRAKLRFARLEYATDTKIIRFKKIVSNANPFDERWSGYYEERDGEKMLNSTNGREKLLKVWRNQHRCCPVCNEPITSETSFKVHKVFRSGKSPWLEMVHPECHAVLHKNDSCFVEPGSLMGAL